MAVRHVAGRGRAVFATRDIAAGETVMACAPVVGHPGLPHVGKVSTRLVSSRLVSSRLVSSRLVSSRLVSSRLVNSRLPAPWTLFSPSRLNGYSTTVLPRECCGSQRKGGAPCTACRPPRDVSPFHCCFVSHALRVTVFSCMPATQGHSQLPIHPLPPTASPLLHSQPPPFSPRSVTSAWGNFPFHLPRKQLPYLTLPLNALLLPPWQPTGRWRVTQRVHVSMMRAEVMARERPVLLP